MCGLAGLLRWEGLSADDPARVRAAAGVLAHRGPDGHGLWHDSHAALGFQRLKVIDLSPAGDQPMGNEDGTLHVVFNGEIYNFRELREQLRVRGHAFKSQSDTEVLLHLYEEHGEGMLERLRGMFAFALWDARERRLLLARDPLGVKPLYFAERGGCVAFASEAKALFALGVPRESDPVAIDEALTYRYVPAPRSGFKNVEKLPPGHAAVAEKGTLRYRAWWKLPEGTDEAYSRESYGARQRKLLEEMMAKGLRPRLAAYEHWIATEAQEQIQQAVARRLTSDVPLGAWLSGGIDSALVVSRMGSGVRTYCAGFAQAEYDERALARASAAALGTQHAEFEMPAALFQALPQIVWHADEPFFDSSCLPAFALAASTKAHVSVVLSGDGGDEMFAGYERYAGMKVYRQYQRLPAPLRRLALAFANWRHPIPSRQGWDRMLRWLEKCRLLESGSGHHPYIAAMELFDPGQKQALYGEGMREATEGCDARECLQNALLRARQAAPNSDGTDVSATGMLQRADLATYLPGDVLHKVDRMSMAHGLEVRSPFLDSGLAAWALRLPDAARMPGRQTKPLLRRAARDVLPDEVCRARKRGFGVPLDGWFRGPLQRTALELFEGSHLAADKLFAPRFWEGLWQQHQRGHAQHGERLYALLALELWYRTFISGAQPLQRPGMLP